MANRDVQQVQQGPYPQWGKRCCKGQSQASHTACAWEAGGWLVRDLRQPCALVSGTGWLRYRGRGYRFGQITSPPLRVAAAQYESIGGGPYVKVAAGYV